MTIIHGSGVFLLAELVDDGAHHPVAYPQLYMLDIAAVHVEGVLLIVLQIQPFASLTNRRKNKRQSHRV